MSFSEGSYPVNMPDYDLEAFWLRPVMAITTNVQLGSGWIVHMEKARDASRLLYYLIREIKTWLNINHITVHNNMTHIVYFRTQRTVIENTKITY